MSQGCKGLTRTTLTIYILISGLELTIERFYQTHSHNTHFKMTVLIRRLLRRRNMSLSRIYCCYIIIGTDFKENHILEQDELFCFVIISSELKKKKKVMWLSYVTKQNKTKPSPFLLLENPGDPGLLITLPKN